jgi:hypothetical protein
MTSSGAQDVRRRAGRVRGARGRELSESNRILADVAQSPLAP